MELIRRLQSSKCAERRSGDKSSWNLRGLAGWLSGVLQGLHRQHPPVIKQMRLMETLSLGGKKQLMLVSCAGESFLVGGGLENVETIVRVRGEVSSGITARNLDETCT